MYLLDVLKTATYGGTILGGPDGEAAFPILTFPVHYRRNGIVNVDNIKDIKDIPISVKINAWTWWAIANILGLTGAYSIMHVPTDKEGNITKVGYETTAGQKIDVINATIFGRVTANGDRQRKPVLKYFRTPRYFPETASAAPAAEGHGLPEYVLGGGFRDYRRNAGNFIH